MLSEYVRSVRGFVRLGLGVALGDCFGGLLFTASQDLGICGCDIPLFLTRDLLEPVEFLSVELVELRVDICVELAGLGGNNRRVSYI